MEKIKELLTKNGYALSTAYGFINGNRYFLNYRQKKVIKEAIKTNLLEEILSLPDDITTQASVESNTKIQEEVS